MKTTYDTYWKAGKSTKILLICVLQKKFPFIYIRLFKTNNNISVKEYYL